MGHLKFEMKNGVAHAGPVPIHLPYKLEAIDDFNINKVPNRVQQQLKKKWTEAISKDKKSVSRYGDSSEIEDFAESIARYLEPNEKLRQAFKESFPNRTKFIEMYLRDYQPQHPFIHNGMLLRGIKTLGGSFVVLATYTGYKNRERKKEIERQRLQKSTLPR